MQWSDQEINHGTAETKFPEVLLASFELRGEAFKKRGQYLRVDQEVLDEMLVFGELSKHSRGVRIDRLCLLFRVYSGLSPGGEGYPVLGVSHYWQCESRSESASKSLYAILYISPENDWLKIMVVEGPSPMDSK